MGGILSLGRDMPLVGSLIPLSLGITALAASAPQLEKLMAPERPRYSVSTRLWMSLVPLGFSVASIAALSSIDSPGSDPLALRLLGFGSAVLGLSTSFVVFVALVGSFRDQVR